MRFRFKVGAIPYAVPKSLDFTLSLWGAIKMFEAVKCD